MFREVGPKFPESVSMSSLSLKLDEIRCLLKTYKFTEPTVEVYITRYYLTMKAVPGIIVVQEGTLQWVNCSTACSTRTYDVDKIHILKTWND